jgi:CRISPR system Cascade subunit CasC
MSNQLYIDYYIIQTLPPSNINRDDAGAPKHALYGGVDRARVSSQAWKRAARKAFAEHQPRGDQATRTRQIRKLLAEDLASRGGMAPESAERTAEALAAQLGIKSGKKAENTSYLLFFGRSQLTRIGDEALALGLDVAELSKEELTSALSAVHVHDLLSTGHPADVALFGRMIADLADLNVDAAVQVAHAISTHPVELEFDYFTAVDDENAAEDTGAGMIGHVDFNSATYYRYATLGVPQLAENLGGDIAATIEAVNLFTEHFVKSIPSGHQNAFGHQTRPEFVAVVARADLAVNLVSAFEAPVDATGRGISSGSIKRLAALHKGESGRWGDAPIMVAASYGATLDDSATSDIEAAFGPSLAFGDVVTKVSDAVLAFLDPGAGGDE